MNDTNERSAASTGSTANDRQVTRRAILGALAAMSGGAASAASVEFIESSPKPILIAVKMDIPLAAGTLRRIHENLRPIAERVGVPFVVVPKGMTLEAVVDPRESGK
jgi:hypothetical protein